MPCTRATRSARPSRFPPRFRCLLHRARSRRRATAGMGLVATSPRRFHGPALLLHRPRRGQRPQAGTGQTMSLRRFHGPARPRGPAQLLRRPRIRRRRRRAGMGLATAAVCRPTPLALRRSRRQPRAGTGLATAAQCRPAPLALRKRRRRPLRQTGRAGPRPACSTAGLREWRFLTFAPLLGAGSGRVHFVWPVPERCARAVRSVV